MKRVIALLTSFAILVCMMSCLSGCKPANITKGELLNMLCDYFGMYSYTSETPHTDTVKEDNKYFTSVQAAYEWEIIDDKQINTDDKVDKDFLSSVLVKSVGVANVADMSREDITQYAVDNQYVDFTYRGRTDGMRYVTFDEAEASLSKSALLWSERKYTEITEDITYGENTHELTQHTDSVVSNLDGSVTVPSELVSNVKVGDSYIAKDPVTNAPKLYTVKEVSNSNGKTVIKPEAEQPSLETSIQELDASGSLTPDLTECVITDGLGNVLKEDASAQTQSNTFGTVSAAPLGSGVDGAETEDVAKAKFAINFKIDDITITGSVSSDKISFKAKGDIWTNKSKTAQISVDKSYDIKDISLDYDYDISWFKLKSAYAKLNYTTVDTTKVGIKYENTLIDKHPSLKRWDKESVAKSIQSGLAAVQGKAGKTIKICTVPVYTNGVMSFNIDVKLKFSLSGEVELVVTTSNAKGIEYKNGNIRYIKEEKKDTDVKISAKAELTLYIGASFNALGVNIVGLGIEGGVGAKGTVIIHLIDQERHLMQQLNTEAGLTAAENTASAYVGVSVDVEGGQTVSLNTEICFDYKVYGILKFTLDSDSVIGKIFKGTEIEIFGEKNASFLSGHIEDGVDVKKCTREFKIDEEEEKDAEEKENDIDAGQSGNGTILDTGYLDIDTYFVSLSAGENYTLVVENIPDGYAESDITFKSTNDKIARVDSNGKITAVASGSTVIKVQTKDGKYNQECAVYVIADNTSVQFVPLSYMVNGLGVRV